jgi:hypothetical protein
MNKKWSWFLAAAVFVGFWLLRGGAPPLAVAAGIGGAAALMVARARRAA